MSNEQPIQENFEPQSKPVQKNKTIAMVVIAVVLIAGGAYAGLQVFQPKDESQVAGSGEGNLTDRQNQNSDRAPGRQVNELPQFQGATTTADELTEGSQVVAFGTANADGSLTADMIRLGEFNPGEFRGFANRQSGAGSNESGNENGQGDITSPEGFNPGEFQNLSPEARQQRFQELQQSGQIPEGFGSGGGFRGGFNGQVDGGLAGRAQGAEIIQGEIIDKDDISITVKLADGGSRLVVYTDDTRIVKVAPPSNGDE